jgi:hypothetical protein
MAVHEAPIDDDEPPAPETKSNTDGLATPPSDGSDDTEDTPEEIDSTPVAAEQPKPAKPDHPLPVGAIVTAIFFMVGLSALTVMVYLQS